MDCGPPGSSVHGILQARILEWVDIYFSRGSSHGIKPMSPMSPALAGGFFTTSTTWEALGFPETDVKADGIYDDWMFT